MMYHISLPLIINIKFAALQNDHNIVSSEEALKIKDYVNKVRAIKDVLRRDHMKVAFFGRYGRLYVQRSVYLIVNIIDNLSVAEVKLNLNLYVL